MRPLVWMAWLLVWMLGAAGAWGAPGTNVPQMTVIHTKYGPVWRASTAARVAPVRPRAWVQVPVSDGERQIARAAAERADALLRAGGLPSIPDDPTGSVCMAASDRPESARGGMESRTTIVCLSVPSAQGVTSFTTASGGNGGHAFRLGNRTTFYSPGGGLVGSATINGGTVEFYSAGGSLIGRASR